MRIGYAVRQKDATDDEDLVTVSECCSQMEGGPFDGPVMFDDKEAALEAFEMDEKEFDGMYELIPLFVKNDD